MIFPSNLTLVGSIIVNHIFVSTTQHWLWIANSGFWFNPHRFWLSGWSCFNQKQPTTDYEVRSWQELIFLIYFDGPHLFFNCFLDTWGIFLWGAHPSQFWHLILWSRNFLLRKQYYGSINLPIDTDTTWIQTTMKIKKFHVPIFFFKMICIHFVKLLEIYVKLLEMICILLKFKTTLKKHVIWMYWFLGIKWNYEEFNA